MFLTLGCLGALLALASTALVLSTREFLQTRSVGQFAAALFCLFFTVLWIRAIHSGISDALVSRVVPYFQQRIGLPSLHPFSSGLALAANLRTVDALARELGIESLSSFGFHDDLAGDQVQWHDAADGLRVVARLREATKPGAVADDLSQLEQGLMAAHARGIPFCLILRAGRDEFVSGHEMERRVGSFW